MNSGITVTKSGEALGEKNLRVEVSRERIEQAEGRAASQYAKRAKLPGFRKGKVPVSVVRRRYGEAIRDTVLRDLIGESWKVAVEQEDIEPVADPRVKDLKFEEDEPLTFEFMVEVKPDIKLERLGGFQLTRQVEPVSEESVNAQLEELRKQQAPWAPVEGEKPQPGDLVHMSLATITEGEAEEDKAYQIVLGENQALPEIEDQLMTMVPGEVRETTVTFPEDFGDETKRGQSQMIRISLAEVKRQDLPEVNDDFARQVGDFESVEALTEAIREDLELSARREADGSLRSSLINEIIQANNLQAPRPAVERLLHAYAEGYQIPRENFEKFAQEFGPIAESQVKRELVIDAVREQAGLDVSQEEIDERVAEIAQRQKLDRDQVYSSLKKSNRIKELERNLLEEKVFSYLLEQSTVTEK